MRETRYSARQKRGRDDESVHEPNYKEYDDSERNGSVDSNAGQNTPITEPPCRKRATKSIQRDMLKNNDQQESSSLVVPESKRSSQKPREEVAVDLDSLGLVMEFLGHRELLAFASTCKTLRDKLTMSMVVKSAAVSGNRIVTGIIASVERDLRQRSIYLPSPLRLLRLVNAKLCEFCCGRASEIQCRRGIMSCYACPATRTFPLPRSPSRAAAILRSSRVCYMSIYGPTYYCTAEMFKAIGIVAGERVGPIATVELYQTMVERSEEFPNDSVSDIIDQVLPHDPALHADYDSFMRTRKTVVKLSKKARSIRRAERKRASLSGS